MGNDRPIIRGRFFGPEAIEVMSLAFDNAAHRLLQKDIEAREILAMRILALASCGELDPARLTSAAMKNLAQ